MNKPGQKTAMISSTAIDLQVYRKDVVEAYLPEDVFPIGMEQLPARDANGVQVSLEMVDKTNIYDLNSPTPANISRNSARPSRNFLPSMNRNSSRCPTWS